MILFISALQTCVESFPISEESLYCRVFMSAFEVSSGFFLLAWPGPKARRAPVTKNKTLTQVPTSSAFKRRRPLWRNLLFGGVTFSPCALLILRVLLQNVRVQAFGTTCCSLGMSKSWSPAILHKKWGSWYVGHGCAQRDKPNCSLLWWIFCHDVGEP